MAAIPLDQGNPRRRRVGPFWIEEGFGPLVVGFGILLAAALLYGVAVLSSAP